MRDDFFRANGFGLAQYVSYALTDKLTLNGRAEVFRDDNGLFVAAFPGVFDPVNVEAGKPAPFVKSVRREYVYRTDGRRDLQAQRAGADRQPDDPPGDPLGPRLRQPSLRRRDEP